MAGSPVNVDSVIIPGNSLDVCEVLLSMSQAVAVLRADLEYRVNAGSSPENLPTAEFAGQLAAMILPPGTVMAFAISSGTSDPESLQTALDAHLEPYWGARGDGEDPWFWICDGENGRPNLMGRFVMGAGKSGSEDEISHSSLDTGGASEITLGMNNIPNHDHKLGAYGTAIAASGKENDLLIKDIPAESAPSFSGALLQTTLSGENSTSATKVNKVTLGVHSTIAPEEDDELDAIDTRPPFVVLVYAVRSTRLA